MGKRRIEASSRSVMKEVAQRATEAHMQIGLSGPSNCCSTMSSAGTWGRGSSKSALGRGTAVLSRVPYQQRELAQGLFIQGTQQPTGDEAQDAALINLDKVQTDVVMSSPAVLKSTFPATTWAAILLHHDLRRGFCNTMIQILYKMISVWNLRLKRKSAQAVLRLQRVLLSDRQARNFVSLQSR